MVIPGAIPGGTAVAAAVPVMVESETIRNTSPALSWLIFWRVLVKGSFWMLLRLVVVAAARDEEEEDKNAAVKGRT